MQEFVFAIDCEPGCNPVADALAAHPEITVRSLSCHVSPESLWRVDHATGPADSLDALADAFAREEYRADCLAADDCGADCETHVLDRSDETLVVYSYWERTPACTSVPHLALDHLGEGVLFETRREGRRYTWRLILPRAANVGAFYAALQEAITTCAGVEMLRLTDVEPTGGEATPETLPAEQAAALRAAVERGYYETPRKVDLSALAADLDVPRSTLSYRLRRAEAQLAKRFVAEMPLAGAPPAV